VAQGEQAAGEVARPAALKACTPEWAQSVLDHPWTRLLQMLKSGDVILEHWHMMTCDWFTVTWMLGQRRRYRGSSLAEAIENALMDKDPVFLEPG